VAFAREVAQTVLRTKQGPTLREVLKAANAVDVAVNDPGVRANCNTPEALVRAWAEGPGRAGSG
jgi:hypothetical protein